LKADVKRRIFVMFCLRIYSQTHLNRLCKNPGPPQE
jgi:hypothetical protein